jgi:hypothetical protein
MKHRLRIVAGVGMMKEAGHGRNNPKESETTAPSSFDIGRGASRGYLFQLHDTDSLSNVGYAAAITSSFTIESVAAMQRYLFQSRTTLLVK